VYGKFNRELSGISEEYGATEFLVLSYFPLVPLGAYRVSREQGSKELQFVSKQPLNWLQIAWTWMKSLGVVAAVGFAIVLIAEMSRHR
jgi:hypothetical protein